MSDTQQSEPAPAFDHELDCRRLLCPMPVIKTQNKLKEINAGDVLKVVCTDPGALHDIPAWCRVNGHEYLHDEQHGREYIIYVKACE